MCVCVCVFVYVYMCVCVCVFVCVCVCVCLCVCVCVWDRLAHTLASLVYVARVLVSSLLFLMQALLLLLLVPSMCVKRDIALVSQTGTVSITNGVITAPVYSQPIGNAAPSPAGTVSPYQTYSASWVSNPIDWTISPNAYVFDTSNIAKMSLDNLGANFAIIRTTKPTNV